MACVGRQLTKFNGDFKPAANLRALAAAVNAAGSKPYQRFDFGEWLAVIETSRSKKLEAGILGANDVASWCSADVDPRGDVSLMGCISLFSSSK